jgi:hypothetical protein
MTIVWILSYLAVFMLGGIAMFAAFYFSVTITDKRIDQLIEQDLLDPETNEKPESSLREWN